MERKKRLRFEIAAASRANVLAGAARDPDMNQIRAKYNISTAGVGGTRVMGIFVSGGDYWNA